MNVWWCDLNKHTVKCFSGMITYIVDARIQICRQISVSWKRPFCFKWNSGCRHFPVVSGSWLLPEHSNQFKLTAESREIIQLRFHTYWNLATTSVINSNYVVLITILLSNVQSQSFGSRWRPETERGSGFAFCLDRSVETTNKRRGGGACGSWEDPYSWHWVVNSPLTSYFRPAALTPLVMKIHEKILKSIIMSSING